MNGMVWLIISIFGILSSSFFFLMNKNWYVWNGTKKWPASLGSTPRGTHLSIFLFFHVLIWIHFVCLFGWRGLLLPNKMSNMDTDWIKAQGRWNDCLAKMANYHY